jgi:hypothetical protein
MLCMFMRDIELMISVVGVGQLRGLEFEDIFASYGQRDLLGVS